MPIPARVTWLAPTRKGDAMTVGLTGRIARASARRPWLTIGLWAVVLTIAGYFAGTISDHVTSRQGNLVTTEADRADEFDAQRDASAAGEKLYAESVIITSDVERAGNPTFDAAITDAARALEGVDGVSAIVTPAEGAPVSGNGASAMITFATTADEATLRAAVAAIDARDHDGVDAFVFGEESSALAVTDLAAEELARSELFGIIAALVILVLVFGALVAAGLPLVVAVASVTTATAIGAIVARATDAIDVPMSDSLTVFAAMLGLALGIDYSLLAVQRFREELAHGRDVVDAVTVTGATANRAVLFSGATVVVSLGGLLFVPLNTFLGIGVGVMAVAFASVTSALFLLPAVLRLLGHRVNAGRVPTARTGAESPRWRRLATWVASRPVRATAMGGGVLLVSASPLLGLQFANPGPDAMPADFVAHRAYDVLMKDFGRTDTSTTIAVDRAGAAAAAVERLAADVDADPAFTGTTLQPAGDVAFIDTHDRFDSGDPRSQEAITRLRHEIIPAALRDTTARAYVGGDTAAAMDQQELLTSTAPWSVAFILVVTFALLLVMFRSVVVPFKAIVLNVLSTLATFGAVVAMYQWEWGRTLFGFPELDGMSPYMPVMIFALVFGLSMDYHVFLLARVKERYDATGDSRAAVTEGVTRTGPLITGAAAIMVAVFGGFAAADIPELSQWGFGLAFGVILDATVIRVLLVPAAMVCLGRANWYLPRWLGWLPQLPTEVPPTHAPERENEPVLV